MSTENPSYSVRRKIYDEARFKEALRAALIAAVIAFGAAVWYLGGQGAERIPINPPPEVRTATDTIQNTETNLTTAPPPTVATLCLEGNCTIWTVYQILGAGLGDIVRTLLSPPEGMTIAWFIRFLAVIITLAIVGLYFRGRLSERHELELDNIRTKLFKNLHARKEFVVIIPIGISFLLLTYIMASAVSRLLEIMFVGLTLSAIETGLLGIVFAGLLAYVLVHYISVVNTSDLLYIGYAVIFMGFAWGFSIAEQSSDIPGCGSYWYCHSISNTGIQKSSGLIFTLTMVGMGTFLWLVWRDIALILESLFGNEHLYTNAAEPQTPPKPPYWTCIRRGMAAAFIMIVCIGLVPTFDHVHVLGIPLAWIHLFFAFGGPILLIAVGKFGVTNIARKFLPNHFWYVTCGLLAGDVIAFVLFLLWNLKVDIGIPTLNVTAFELVILGLVGIWFYGMVYYSVAIIDALESDEFVNGINLPVAELPKKFRVDPAPATTNAYFQMQQRVVKPIDKLILKQVPQQSKTENPS